MSSKLNVQRRRMQSVLFLSFFSILSGCSICGGISSCDSEVWLSSFMKRSVAHKIAYHEKVDESVLVSVVDKWYLNDDIRYLVLTHPNFPKAKRVAYIEKNGCDDYFFENALRQKVADGDECRAYLRYLKKSWVSLSECRPLASILKLLEGASEDFYLDVWSEYKEKRERFPIWGYLPLISNLDRIRFIGIEALRIELLDIVVTNKSLPRKVRMEIAEQLKMVDYRGRCKAIIARSGGSEEYFESQLAQVEKLLKEFYPEDFESSVVSGKTRVK